MTSNTTLQCFHCHQEARICEVRVQLLVDTGAGVSLIHVTTLEWLQAQMHGPSAPWRQDSGSKW